MELELEDDRVPDMGGGEKLAVFLNERGQVFKEVMLLAIRNLAIAQERDRVQYKGKWLGCKLGDFVLMGRQTKGTLDIATHPGVVQVTELRGSGVLDVQGSDGVRICEQIKNVAYCPVRLRGWTRFTIVSAGGGVMKGGWCCVLCVTRVTTFWCLSPSLDEVPAGSWTCRRHRVR